MVDACEPAPELGGEVGSPEITPIVPHQPRSDASDGARGMTTRPRLRRGAGMQHPKRAQCLLHLPKPCREDLPRTGGRAHSSAIGADLAHSRLQDEAGALGSPGGVASQATVQ